MPGEFYIEGKAEKLNLQGIGSALTVIDGKLEAVKARTDKLQGETRAKARPPPTGSWARQMCSRSAPKESRTRSTT